MVSPPPSNFCGFKFKYVYIYREREIERERKEREREIQTEGVGISWGTEKISCWNSEGQLKKKCNFQGWSKGVTQGDFTLNRENPI